MTLVKYICVGVIFFLIGASIPRFSESKPELAVNPAGGSTNEFTLREYGTANFIVSKVTFVESKPPFREAEVLLIRDGKESLFATFNSAINILDQEILGTDSGRILDIALKGAMPLKTTSLDEAYLEIKELIHERLKD
jgi:hypothetical protein